jgi:hypothetical protein
MTFFQKDDGLRKVYGAPEESRLVFARMKDPEDNDEEWAKEATFVGYEMKQALAGKEVARLFSIKDLKKLKVISKEKATKLLSSKKKPAKKTVDLPPVHGKDGAGMVQIKDRKK